MTEITVKWKRLDPAAQVPTRKEGDAGWDLTCIEAQPGPTSVVVRTGLAVEIPPGYCMLIVGRSGLARNLGVDVIGGLVDSSYRGEINVLLTGLFLPKPGQRVAQALFLPVPEVKWSEVDYLVASDRDGKGFGSSGL